ncbi:phage baseplate assembly protein V [Roseateles sp. BYS96W]|uniref:Phage baseplate assembly protein V n=1 Tax=Pelomonas nitida TaxID=3299027 RepID=A0ABW7G4I7_9BURK
MTDAAAAIRAIVRDELAALRLPDLAVVTSVFAHSGDDDGHNHECNVQLREGSLELRKVPIATPHVGMVSAPQVGDLVLLAYVGGDPNRAVVVGRLYSEKANPPKHAENEWRVESPLAGASSIAIDKDESVVVTAGKTIVTVKKDGAIEVAGEAELKIEVKGAVQLKCTDCKIDASGNIDLGDGGAGVITEASHKCYFTGKALVPSKTVKAKG